ncbi:hypothetical protein DVJ83_14785 (plasmid) [Deinococcus wulumuqiensis]|uniref:Uncharacterized protein n=2 Tax=Deinococcus wulumuqiensis TaxID=980427 RepID=A0A345IL81_9DEIO|nr:hypothetical protein DVJ83_14785 [Deinococcus wulumuqiensis]
MDMSAARAVGTVDAGGSPVAVAASSTTSQPVGGMQSAGTVGQAQAAPAPVAPAPVAPAPQPAPASMPYAQTAAPLHTEAGWLSARSEVASSAALDSRAVDSYHTMLNTPAAGADTTPYISRETAEWDMQRKGMLPSQREENEQRITTYMQQNGVSRNEAMNSLQDSRGLVQHDQPTPPRPPQYASAAEELAAKQAENNS